MASAWWAETLCGGLVSQGQVSLLAQCLADTMSSQFASHWYYDQPSRGQALRVVHCCNGELDEILSRSMHQAGIYTTNYLSSTTITMWIDPGIVEVQFHSANESTSTSNTLFQQPTMPYLPTNEFRSCGSYFSPSYPSFPTSFSFKPETLAYW